MQARRRPAEPEPAFTDSAVAFRPGRGDAGGWRLREPIGRGGSASVWRAVDATGRVAALKIPHAGGADVLRYEHSLLCALPHPHIVATFGMASSRGHAALALEYLPAGDFVPFAGGPPQHWLPALRGVLAALSHLQAHGYSHCDVKARNVLLAADGSPRLIDFAAARPLDAPLRRSIATAACTPAGLSTSGRAADCFAFAALTFELATGCLPYGVAGARRRGDAPAEVPIAARLAPLLRVVVRVLRAGGRVDGGLWVFADDIESALKAYC